MTNSLSTTVRLPKLHWAFFAFLIAGLPLANAAGLISDNGLNLWGRYLCFAIAAIGLDLIWGYTGILSLCHAFFFCLGGYCIGMHMLLMTGEQGAYGSKLPDFMVWNQVETLPWFWVPFDNILVTLILALAVAGAAAGLIGFLAFRSRIKGVYFAIITQALALATWLIFLRNETMLGGTNGLTDFKTLAGMDLANPNSKTILYLITATTLFAIYLASRYVTESKLGRILIAIRDSENRVRFTGYSITGYKLFIFVFGALIAAVGGMLYVPQTGIITPGRMDVAASISMVIWVAFGGRASLVGPIVGALAVNFAYSILTTYMAEYWPFILGAMFIIVVLYLPEGLVGLGRRIIDSKKSKPPEPPAEAPPSDLPSSTSPAS